MIKVGKNTKNYEINYDDTSRKYQICWNWHCHPFTFKVCNFKFGNVWPSGGPTNWDKFIKTFGKNVPNLISFTEFCTLIYSYSESAEDRETNVGSNYQVLFSFKVATHNVWARARPTVTGPSEKGVEEGNRPPTFDFSRNISKSFICKRLCITTFPTLPFRFLDLPMALDNRQPTPISRNFSVFSSFFFIFPLV